MDRLQFFLYRPILIPRLNKLTCLPCMGLHSADGRALQRERRGHGFESRWSPEILFFLATVFSRLNAPSVYFKLGPTEPAFIWSGRLIGARRLLTRCFIKLIYYHPTSEAKAKLVKTGRSFPSSNVTNFPWVFSYSHYSILHAYYRMLQSKMC